MFRAVKDNETNLVLAIGNDESQGGEDYHGMGKWCEFTFQEIPQRPGEDWHHEIENGNVIAVENA
jgi:hypothetical protein